MASRGKSKGAKKRFRVKDLGAGGKIAKGVKGGGGVPGLTVGTTSTTIQKVGATGPCFRPVGAIEPCFRRP